MDIVIVFLNKKINIELYIDQPIEYSEKDKIYRMLYIFYNFKQLGNI